MEKRIYLDDDNHLVVVTNKGKIEKGGSTAFIEGDYIVDDIVVGRLLALLNDEVVCTEYEEQYYLYYLGCPTRFQTRGASYCMRKGEIYELLKKMKEELDDCCSEKVKYIDKHRKINEKYNDLLEKVKKHNATRRPWERKIDLD